MAKLKAELEALSAPPIQPLPNLITLEQTDRDGEKCYKGYDEEKDLYYGIKKCFYKNGKLKYISESKLHCIDTDRYTYNGNVYKVKQYVKTQNKTLRDLGRIPTCFTYNISYKEYGRNGKLLHESQKIDIYNYKLYLSISEYDYEIVLEDKHDEVVYKQYIDYYENGQIKLQMDFDSDKYAKYNSVLKIFNDPFRDERFIHPKKHTIGYYEDGSLWFEVLYDNDTNIMTSSKTYYPNGQVKQERLLKDEIDLSVYNSPRDVKDTDYKKVKCYNENGSLKGFGDDCDLRDSADSIVSSIRGTLGGL